MTARAIAAIGSALRLELAATIAVSLVMALAVARGFVWTAWLALLIPLVLAAGIRRWQRSVYGLLAYLPVSGIPILAFYPKTAVPVLLKDLLFVLPAYLGFAVLMTSRRMRASFEGAPLTLLSLLGLLVALQALNPALPNLLVGAIGIKVWLFYVPLLFLGYHLIGSRQELSRLLALMSFAAVLPAVIGIVEALLLAGGHGDVVYGVYGDAAAAASTQNFAATGYVGGGILHRIPSTFSFATQYYLFVASMVAVTYAWWRGSAGIGRAVRAGGPIWLLMLAACFLSGARGAFLFVPLLVALIVMLERGPLRLPPARIIAPVVAFLVAAAVIGANAGTVLRHALVAAGAEFQSIFVDGFRYALATSWLGLGTGLDTNASHYALSPEVSESLAGRGYESWYVKATLELGIAGLVLLVALLVSLVALGVRQHRRLRDPGLRVVSASLLGFLIWNAIYGVKAHYVDLDPINVYFWLFAGILFKLPHLDRPSAPGVPRGHSVTSCPQLDGLVAPAQGPTEGTT